MDASLHGHDSVTSSSSCPRMENWLKVLCFSYDMVFLVTNSHAVAHQEPPHKNRCSCHTGSSKALGALCQEPAFWEREAVQPCSETGKAWEALPLTTPHLTIWPWVPQAAVSTQLPAGKVWAHTQAKGFHLQLSDFSYFSVRGEIFWFWDYGTWKQKVFWKMCWDPRRLWLMSVWLHCGPANWEDVTGNSNPP